LRLEPALGKDPKLSGSPHSYMAHQKVKDVRYKGGGFLSAIGITKRPPSFQRIEITEPIDWIIQKEKYFLFVMIPKMRPKRCSFFKYEDGGFGIDALFGEYRLEPRAYLNNTIQIYAGPKDHRILENYGLMKLSGLWFLARITLSILSFFHSIVGNYGIAIIFLTILTKVVLHPLTRKNFKVMKQMARLKPHMERLRAKHKDDHQTLQREMMKLYKEHNVNPFGGCLPLLLQLPVFFALFSALNNGIELRGAPFVFWIRDLSARDPYFILPILMGATMFIQQKMSPTAGDPSTEKMMLILPIVFTFLFLSFPSGLVLYWLTQNILTIFEHWLIEKGIER
jgi:YidC/Oxa1 family membrane protein insertase